MAKIKLRRDTAATWASVNPILASGEPGLETDTNKVKYGDGVTHWNDIPHATVGADLGNLKISGNTLGTVNNPDTGGWGGYDIYLDPNGEGWAGIQIPGLTGQEAGAALTIFNNKVSTSTINLNTTGGVHIASDRGTLNIGTDMEVPGAPTHFHIAFDGSNLNVPTSELYLGDDFNFVRVASYAGGVEIGTNTRTMGSVQNNWLFNSSDNSLYVPTDGRIKQDFSVTRTVQGNTSGGAGVVWTSSAGSAITGVKLTIQVEASEVGGDGQWHTQVCEATIAGRLSGGEPMMTVYAITHTSVDDLATFTVQRNMTTSEIEVVATPTVTNANNGVQYRIHSVELYTRD